MRLIHTIAHPKLKIMVYGLDRWYYLEMEAGPMKQGYKFDKEAFAGPVELEQHLTQHGFWEVVYTQFESMYKAFQPVSGR
jgi:hypothetical protein